MAVVLELAGLFLLDVSVVVFDSGRREIGGYSGQSLVVCYVLAGCKT